MSNEEIIQEINKRISLYEKLLETATTSNDLNAFRSKRDELVSLLSVIKR